MLSASQNLVLSVWRFLASQPHAYDSLFVAALPSRRNRWSRAMIPKKITIPLLIIAAWLCAARLASAVNVWVTAGDKTQLLSQQNDILFQPGAGSGGTAISVLPATKYQTVSGFGAAMTDSSSWLLQNKLTAVQRDKLMRQMFSPQSGIG